ncbi:MAG: Cna B-type domain-containing protein [Atopobiaceae bacterium]|nr:Cna B-type domain-containing protein [Atopobiaceae bacterium]
MRGKRKSSNALRAALSVLLSISMVTSGVPTTAVAKAVEEFTSSQGVGNPEDASSQTSDAMTDGSGVTSNTPTDATGSSDDANRDDTATVSRDETSDEANKEQSSYGSILVRVEVRGIPAEVAPTEHAVTVRNADGLYLNDVHEFVEEEARLHIAQAGELDLAEVPVGTYTVREVSEDRDIGDYTYNDKASKPEVQLEVTEGDSAEATLVSVYESTEAQESEEKSDEQKSEEGESEEQESEEQPDKEAEEQKAEENADEQKADEKAEEKSDEQQPEKQEPQSDEQAAPKAEDKQFSVGEEDEAKEPTPEAEPETEAKQKTAANDQTKKGPALRSTKSGGAGDALKAGGDDAAEDDYTEREETNNLNLLLDEGGLTITSMGKTYDLTNLAEGETVELEKGEPFTLHLSFAENDHYGLKKDETPLVYSLPSGMTLPDSFESFTFDMDLGDEGTLKDNRVEYDREKHQLKVYWNTDDADGMDALYASPEVMFQIDVSATMEGTLEQIEFSQDLVVEVNQTESHSAKVEKTGTYNKETNQVDYTVTVTSIGRNTNVVAEDKLTGKALSYNWDDDSKPKTVVSYAGEADPAPQFKVPDQDRKCDGFKLIIPSMANGEVFSFTYSANVDTQELGTSGVQDTLAAGNEVTVLGVTTPAPATLIDWSDISKDAKLVSPSTIDSRTVEWTIVTNNSRIGSFAGSHIKDSIDQGSRDRMTYTGAGLTIKVYDQDNRLYETRDVAWDKVGVTNPESDQTWDYLVPKTDGIYKYEITYQTRVALKDKNESFRVENTAESRGGTADGFIDLGPGVGESIYYHKTVNAVTKDYDDYYVDWDLSIDVPANSYWATEQFVITDTLPSRQIEGTWYYDTFDSLTLEPSYEEAESTHTIGTSASNHDEFYRLSLVDPNGEVGQQVVLTFYHLDSEGHEQPGLSPDAAARTISLRIRSKNNQDWLNQSAGKIKDRRLLTHKNSLTVNRYGTKSASAYIAKQILKKERVPLGEDENGEPIYMGRDENGMPYYQFRLTMQGITKDQLRTNPIVLVDAFNADDAQFFAYDDASAKLLGGDDDVELKTLRNGPFTSPSNTKTDFYAEPTDAGVNFHLTSLESSDLLDSENNSTPYGTYAIEYRIKVKDANALSKLNRQSIDAHEANEESQESGDDEEGGGAISMTNSINGYGGTDSIPFDYEYEALDKSMLAESGSNVASYTINVNPDKCKLNGGKPMELTDKFSPNQSIQYDTIRVTKAINKDGRDMTSAISWDFRGNVGTFVIPDETAVTITYSSTLLPRENESYWNEARMKGYHEKAKQTLTVTQSASGSAKSYKLRVFKYADGKMEKGLSGATFRLLDASGKIVKYRKKRVENGVTIHEKGDPVTVTTGEDGYATLFLHMGKDGVALRKNTVYYLDEIQAPKGYRSDYVHYGFVISDNPDYQAPDGVYVYHSNDILKVRNTPEEADLTIVKRFAGSVQLTAEQKSKISFRIDYRANATDDWSTIENITYNDENFVDGVYTLPPNEYKAGQYRVTEIASDLDLPGDVVRTVTYLVNGEETTLDEDGAVDLTIEDVGEKKSHQVIVTNEYDKMQYDFTKVDSSTGAVVPGAEFTTYAVNDGSTFKTYKTNKNGAFSITKADGYADDTLYYVVETKAPNGYIQPSDIGLSGSDAYFQKYYFYFSNGDAVPAGLPADASAVNLAKIYASEEVANEKIFKTTAKIEAKKNADKLLVRKDFAFELLDAAGNVIVTKSAQQGGTANLNRTFSTADLYDPETEEFLASKQFHYTLREKIPAGAQAYDKTTGLPVTGVTYSDAMTSEQRQSYTWKQNGFTYSSKEVPVTVTVTRSEDENNIGKLSASVAYGTAPTADANLFTNAYEAKGEADVAVGKKLTGKVLQAGQFSFTLSGNGQNQTKTNAADGSVTFDAMSYDEKDLDPDTLSKTYVYTISEKSFNIPGVSRDTSNGPSNIYAQVTLTDQRNGTIKTAVKYFKDAACTQELTGSNIAFVNKYQASGNLTLKTDKTFEDDYWPKGTARYTFKVTHDTSDGYTKDVPSFSNIVLNASDRSVTGGSASFNLNNLKDDSAPSGYVSSRTFKYKVTEQVPNDKRGVTYDSKVIPLELTIADDGQGHITVTSLMLDGSEMVGSIEGRNDYNVGGTFNVTPGTDSFHNSYDASGEGEIPVLKKITGERTWQDFDSFTFTLKAETDGAPMPSGDGLTTNQDGSVSLTITKDTANHTGVFGNITRTLADIKQDDVYPASKTYAYTITETIPDGAKDWVLNGVTYHGAPHQIELTFRDGGSGTIDATLVDNSANDGDEPNKVTFDNHYKADGQALIEVGKSLEGWQLAKAENQTFTFTLKSATSGSDAAPIRYKDANGVHSVNEMTKTVTLNNGTGKATFDLLYYDTDSNKHNNFVYQISESFPNGKTSANTGITLANPIYAMVSLSQDDLHGHLTPTVTYYSNAACTQELTGDAVAFKNKYKPEGELALKSTKTFENNYWPTGSKKTKSYRFDITSTDSSAPTFSDIVLNAENHSVSGGKAQFTIDHLDQNADNGEKTYTYTVSEVVPSGAQGRTLNGVTYSNETHTLELKLRDDGEGHIIPSVRFDGTGDFTEITSTSSAPNVGSYQNSYDAEGDGYIKVSKLIDGRAWKNGETYGFTLVPSEGSLPIVGDTTVSVGAGETKSFGKIHATLANLATNDVFASSKSFNYQIFETIPDGAKSTEGDLTYGTAMPAERKNHDWIYEGVTYKGAPRDVVLTFTDEGNGHLAYTVKESGNKDVTNSSSSFTNTYYAKGTAELKVTKSFDAQEWPGNQAFSFDLAATNWGNLPKNAGGQTVTHVTSTKDQPTQTFGTITYTEADMKTNGVYAKDKYFTYTVKETVPSDKKGVIYDTTTHTVTVHVVDNQDGTLSTSYTFSNDDAWSATATDATATIRNSYDASTKINVAGRKAVDVAHVSKDGFGFTLVPTEGSPAQTNTTATSAADGSFSFQNLTFELADIEQTVDGKKTYPATTFTYTIKENDITKNGYTKGEGASDVTVTVDVSYNANTGVLTATPSYKRGETLLNAATFTNSYDATGSIALSGTKVLTGRAITNDDKWNFTLAPVTAGAPIRTTKGGWTQTSLTVQNAAGTYALGTLYYQLSDLANGNGGYLEEKTFSYKVTEADPAGTENRHIVNDDAASNGKTLNVKVAQHKTNGKYDGTLSVTLVGAETAPTFTNKYTAAGEVYVPGTKKMAGRDFWNATDPWTFTVAATSPTPNAPLVMSRNDVSRTSIEVVDGKGIAYVVKSDKLWDYGFHLSYTLEDLKNADGAYASEKTFYYTVTESGTAQGVTNDPEATRTIAITVTDPQQGDGKLNVALAPTSASTEYVNTYHAAGSTTVVAAKALDGRKLEKDAFTFTLTGEGQNQSKTNDADGRVAFDAINYNESDLGKTYHYTVKEVAPTPLVNGYTYDKSEFDVAVAVTVNPSDAAKLVATQTITQTKDKDGNAIEDGKPVSTIGFSNTYVATGTLKLTATKSFEGNYWPTDPSSFDFELVATGDNASKAPAFGTGKATATEESQTAEFGTASFSLANLNKDADGRYLPTTYTYTVNEDVPEGAQNGKLNGVTYAAQPHALALTLADDGKGHIVPSAKVDGDDVTLTDGTLWAGDFRNTYEAAGEASFFAMKTLAVHDLTAGMFSFELEGPHAGGTSNAQTVSNGNVGDDVSKATFASVPFTMADLAITNDSGKITGYEKSKTFEYKIREVIPEGATDNHDETFTKDGITYHAQEQSFVVTLTDRGDGHLAVAYGRGEDAASEFGGASFRNTYDADGDVAIEGTKGLLGRAMRAGDDWTFTLTGVNGAPVRTSKGGQTQQSVEAHNDGTNGFSFGSLHYQLSDLKEEDGRYVPTTYTYTVTESNGKNGAIPGVTLDTPKTFDVVVADKGNGELTVTSDAAEKLGFSNTYTATGTATIAGAKELSGRAFQEGDAWSFTISSEEQNAPLPSQKTVTITPSEGQSAAFQFSAITYDVSLLADVTPEADGSRTKTYTYTIAESGEVTNVTNDVAKTVKVTISDNATGALAVTTDVTEDKPLVFANDYDASGETTLEGTKLIEGRSFKAGDTWTFTVTNDQGAPMPEHTSVTVNPSSGTSVALDFGKISYTEADAGKRYVYTVLETGSIANVTNDAAQTVIVNIADNGDGTLAITNSSKDENTPLEFTNVYHSNGDADLKGTKTLAGRAFKSGDKWAFDVTASKSTPMPERTSVVVEPTEGSSALIDFGTIHFTQDDLADVEPAADGSRTKTFTYTITESGTVASVDNDAAKTVSITAVDDGNGRIMTISSTSETPLVFANAYTATGETTIHGLKTLSGRAFQEGDVWTFSIASANEKAPLPEKASVTIDASDKASFTLGPIAYTEADAGQTYTYTVTETGDVAGVTNAAAQTVSVKVEDNGDGTLKLTNPAKDEESALVFTNIYKATGSTTLSATKTLTGRTFQKGDVWDFKVTADDPNAPMPQIPEVTLNTINNTTANFGTINYTEADAGKTYTYTITETGDVDGVTNDEPQVVTVKVEDNGDGTLKVTNSAEETGASFTNVYDAEGKAKLSGTKMIVGRDFKSGDTATMKIEAVTKDAPMPEHSTVTVNPAEGKSIAYAFDDITYTLADLQKDDAGNAVETTFTYKVTESTYVMDGVTKGNAEYTVDVTVKDLRNGELDVKVSDNATKLDFTNVYDASGVAKLGGTKFIDTRDFRSGDTATFAIEAITKDAPMPETSTVTVNPTEGKSIAYAFDDITYTLADLQKDDAGNAVETTFTYKVTESACTMDGVTKDATEHEVTVTVTDALDGTLTVVPGENAKTLDFTNTYSTQTGVTLGATKTLANRDLKAGAFTFQLLDAQGKVLDEKENDAEGNVTFDELTYSIPDAGKSFTYIIKEVVPEGAKDNLYGCVTYDTHEEQVEVDVTYDDVAGVLTATANKDAEDIVFANTFETTEIAGHKVWVDDESHKDDTRPESVEVKLQSKGVAGTWDDVEGKTATVTADDLSYEFTDLPKYDGITEYEYRVVEVEVPEGYVATGGTIDDDYVITNTIVDKRDAEEPVVLMVRKEGDEGEVLAGATFELTAEDGTTKEYVTGEDGTASIEFTTTGTWTLRETVAPAGYLLNTQVYDIEVERDGIKSITYDQGDAIWTWLYNLVVRPDYVDNVLTVNDEKTTVAVHKRDLTTGQALTGATLQVLDPSGKVVKEWTSDGTEHTVEHLVTGVTYTLHEAAAPRGYHAAADAKFTIDVDGTVKSSGTMDGNALVVTNTTSELTGTATIQASKLVSGEDGWDENEEFELTLAKADPTTSDVIADDTVMVKSGQTGVFGTITYIQEGTYNYVISEMPGTADDMTYDPAPRYARVEVARNDNGSALETTVSYSEDQKTWESDVPTFHNTHGARIDKFVAGGAQLNVTDPNQTFEYEIVALMTSDAVSAVVEDNLSENLEFVSTPEEVRVEDLGTYNNHREHGSVSATGAAIDAANVGVYIEGKTMTVFLWNVDGANGTDLRGHWVRISFQAKLASTLTAGEINNVATYNIYDANFTRDMEPPEPIHGGETPNATVVPTVDIDVTKVWQDAEGNEAEWPEGAEVTVELLANGEPTGQELTLTTTESTGQFSYMDANDKDGNAIDYTVREVSVTDAPAGFTTMPMSGSVDEGFTITNRLPAEEKPGPETTSVKVTKAWLDAEGEEAEWPEGATVTVELLANNEPLSPSVTMELTEDKQSDTFDNLTVAEDVEYTVRETKVEGVSGYTTDGPEGDAAEGFVITNYPGEKEPGEPGEPVTVPVEKVWEDADGNEIDWPEGVTVTIELYADGEATGKTLQLTAGMPDAEFEELKEGPEYTVRETKVEGDVDSFSTEVEGDAESGFTIRNVMSGSKTPGKKDTPTQNPTDKTTAQKTTSQGGSSTQGAKSTTTTTSQPVTTTKTSTPKTGDPTMGVALPAIVGAVVVAVGIKKRRRNA